jgi:hypothetical protein
MPSLVFVFHIQKYSTNFNEIWYCVSTPGFNEFSFWLYRSNITSTCTWSWIRANRLSSSSSKVCPLYSGFPSPKTKFRHLSLSLVSSSVSPSFVMLRLTPSIHLSLGLPLLLVPSGSHSKIFSGSLFPGILFTCPNHRSRFSSVTSKMFFRTFMIPNQYTHYRTTRTALFRRECFDLRQDKRRENARN